MDLFLLTAIIYILYIIIFHNLYIYIYILFFSLYNLVITSGNMLCLIESEAPV